MDLATCIIRESLLMCSHDSRSQLTFLTRETAAYLLEIAGFFSISGSITRGRYDTNNEQAGSLPIFYPLLAMTIRNLCTFEKLVVHTFFLLHWCFYLMSCRHEPQTSAFYRTLTLHAYIHTYIHATRINPVRLQTHAP